jgi:hypothetical protein
MAMPSTVAYLAPCCVDCERIAGAGDVDAVGCISKMLDTVDVLEVGVAIGELIMVKKVEAASTLAAFTKTQLPSAPHSYPNGQQPLPHTGNF